jgi:hypothetical protein
MILKHLVAAGALGVATMAALPATAMPVDNLAKVAPSNVEQAAWVCGRWRCWWRPNYYYYGPRFYYAPRVYPRYRYYRRW